MVHRFEIVYGRLVYDDGGSKAWVLDLRHIAAIGEYTIAAWPGADDYWEVFVDQSGAWHAVPCGVGAWQDLHETLRQVLGAAYEPRLARSAEWSHVVLWPEEVAGLPLFRSGGRGLELSAELQEFLSRRVNR